jgi:hypothetical protein
MIFVTGTWPVAPDIFRGKREGSSQKNSKHTKKKNE